MTSCPVPHRPRDVGVEHRLPDFGRIEGTHLLANEARPFLRDCGFTDDEILEWADAYIATEGSGDVESFVAWIHEQEARVTS